MDHNGGAAGEEASDGKSADPEAIALGVINPSFDNGLEVRPPPTTATTTTTTTTMKTRDGEAGTEAGGHGLQADHPTSYLETVMHIFKGNVGPGMYAMGDAFHNGGLLLSPILTIFLGIISVHSEHILINCAGRMQRQQKLAAMPDFAETVGLCFANGHERFRPWAGTMHRAVNFFICITQLGLCCVYFVFISSNMKQIYDYYGIELDVHLHMGIILVPMMLPALITQLKYLAWCMTIGNGCMVLGIGITYYYATQDLPSLADSSRSLVGSWHTLPLFFGTAIFAFEGIALVLPLKNAMRRPHDFSRPLGVLNVGMTVVTLLFTTTGFLGYLKWGEEVKGSLTLNLPDGELLAQVVKVMISLGVLFGYALQFFIAIQIMLPSIRKRFDPAHRHPVLLEFCFRILMVLLTFLIAEGVPNLGAFISLIGALCSTALALIFPPIIELTLQSVNTSDDDHYHHRQRRLGLYGKNVLILVIASIGVVTGTYESVLALAKSF
ncbi:proton-coupled amino acid transporter 4-like [Anopheles darlingi]|uniref:proton-coupled amino acid transporter 4-like n=1 Tax=Anopheles darlingi TaxID=43151 RepID=UPI0021000247|nr:proton-coupled amino acid transporter 4-like [Anopheles darlingi]